ncbi:MAG TPA: glycine--tRNA ligase subunit beta [Gammaproteobacteria bacterium]|nr:glycine--tRNA ligase subunit beta [Gammaproteobacteria bacterium]
MTNSRDLLIEIGTEELPPKALKRLSEAFGAGVTDGLKNADLAHGEVSLYASPRRLAVLVRGLAEAQADKTIERRGPALAAAFDDEGCPTKAAEGFARSCGVASVDDLDRIETDKGAWLVYRAEQPGQASVELIPDIVRAALDKLPIPRRMRWGALAAEFVRPVHWVVLLFGDEVIETEILAVLSGRETRGHRFHHPGALYIAEPAAYAPLLETEGFVVADFTARREAVRAQVLEAGARLGGEAVIDEALLDEVTSMVEWPVAIAGDFEERFLDVPAEALISTMKANQKYFHVIDADGKLMPHFVTVANISSRQPERVREGNERVIRPRLSDAEFFWTQDRKRRLDSHIGELKNIVFQQKLGTLYDKAERVANLAGFVADSLGANREWAERAAWLAKCDLMTEMVYEFPELQGIMGRYYALHDGEPEEVALAQDEQYMPRHAGDELPATPTGQALAIADKLDTIAGMFGIQQPPTGSKDPFALRRAALGLLRIIIERQLPLDLGAAIQAAVDGLDDRITAEGVSEKVFDFMMDRLRAYYADIGVTPDVFDAVHARRPTQPLDFDRRVRAVNHFRSLPQADSLTAANKRIANILQQAQEKGIAVPGAVDNAKLAEDAEKTLAERLIELEQEVIPLFDARDYEPALARLADLREAVDRFFDDVMVMVDDEALRANRLALLAKLRNLFLRVADLSRLQG